MAVVVVGGHSRGIGKTSVIAGIIAAFRGRRWTAIKVTSHEHREPGPASFDIYEETDRRRPVDTSRFLAAGASRALLVQVRDDGMASALAALQPVLEAGPVIIESNSVVRLIRPELFIFVVRFDVDEWKPSARELAGKANAVVVVESGVGEPAPGGLPLDLSPVLVFRAHPPVFVTETMIRWIADRLGF
jgi:hypothetical protein